MKFVSLYFCYKLFVTGYYPIFFPHFGQYFATDGNGPYWQELHLFTFAPQFIQNLLLLGISLLQFGHFIIIVINQTLFPKYSTL